MFGVITRVIPYEIPKVEPAFDPATQAFTPGSGAPKTAPEIPTSRQTKVTTDVKIFAPLRGAPTRLFYGKNVLW